MTRDFQEQRALLVDAALARGIDFSPAADAADYRYLVGQTARAVGVFLVWSSDEIDLTEDVYESIVEEAERADLDHDRYVVFSRFSLFVTDDVQWVQLHQASILAEAQR